MTIYIIILHIEGAVYPAGQYYKSMEEAEDCLKARLIGALSRRYESENLDGLSLARLLNIDPYYWGEVQPVRSAE